VKLLSLLLLFLVLPVVVNAQFTFITNNGSITITGYRGFGGAVVIPSTTNGLPVTSIGSAVFQEHYLTNVTIPNSITNIGSYAFAECSMTSVTIPNSVIRIGSEAFQYCTSLTNVTIGNSVIFIGESAFSDCYSMANVTIPNSLTNLGDWTFAFCTNLTSVTIPSSVTKLWGRAFASCTKLHGVYFQGNAPGTDASVFPGDTNATVYYLPGTTGWGATLDGLPTALWMLPYPTILNFEPNFGVQTNGFGFTISWATNISVVVEASTNLANSTWSSVTTNTLTGGWCNFSDPQWTNYPARFYRLRSP